MENAICTFRDEEREIRKIREDLALADKAHAGALFLQADKQREKICGSDVHLRGVVEFSNYCRRNCLYCGLRKDHTELPRYRMNEEEILEAAGEAFRRQCKTIVLQSGEDNGLDIGMLCSVIGRIKKDLGCAVTLSIGERSFEEYRILREAGADRYLIKFETSDPKLFEVLKPDSFYEERFKRIDWLRSLGYQVGTGMIVGLPGQTHDILIRDLLFMAVQKPDMAAVGPFVPHPRTPLANAKAGDLMLTLKMIALTRLMVPRAHIPATAAMDTLFTDGRKRALFAGANVLMDNLTPKVYHKYYDLYPRQKSEEITSDSVPEAIVRAAGRTVAQDQGHSLQIKN